MNNKLTVFTPTYNRAYCLKNLYNSLISQTNSNFEWLIVDDGSTDDTKEMISKWITEKKIEIRYIYQENQGKSIAHNTGVLNAKYELFVCVDSDDYLTDDAVEEILTIFRRYSKNTEIVGVISKRKILNKIDANPFPSIEATTLTDLYYKYNYDRDLVLAYRTKILKKYLFPKIENEKFIPETYVYCQVDQIGKMVLLDKEIYICEYLEDGYSKNIKKIIHNNPKGYILSSKTEMEVSKSFKAILKSVVRYTVGNLIIKNRKFIKELNGFKLKSLAIILLPVSVYAYYVRYK